MSQNSNAVPTTKQTVNEISKAQDYLDERAQQGGKGAERTITDINQALADAKNLVQEKNLGDAVNKLVNDAAAVGNQAASAARSAQSGPGAQRAAGAGQDAAKTAQDAVARAGLSPEEAQRLSREAHEAANQIRRIAQLTVTSPAFRRVLWNWYALIRDTWGPQIDRAVEQRLKEGRKDDLTKQGEAKAQQLKQSGQQQANEAKNAVQSKKDEVTQAGQKIAQAAKQGDAKSAVAGARDEAQKLSKEAKQQWDQQFPEEKREELVQRWQSLRQELQSDPNLRAAIEDLKATVSRLRDTAQPVVERAQQQAENVKQNLQEKAAEAKQGAKQAANQAASQQQQAEPGVSQVAQDARDLLEKFADGQSLQPLINAAKDWANALQNDQKLRKWVDDVQNWVLQTKEDAQKLNNDQHLQQLNDIIDRGRAISQGTHKKIAERLLSDGESFLEALRNDASTQRLQQSLRNVVEDLFVDSNGKFVVKPDVYKQLATALAPSFTDIFKDIRIAHVEEHNDDVDFALDNVVIDASDIQPNQLDVTSIADVSLGKQDTGVDLRFRISAKGINPKIRNAYFRYERHTFPRLSDFGTLDAELTKDGLSFNIDIEFGADTNNSNKNVNRTFRANDVTVSLKGLKLDFQNAQHEVLYTLFKPLIVSRVTKQIENTIKEQLYSYVDELDRAATEVRYRVIDAVEQASGGRIVRGVDDNVGHTQ